MDMILIQFFWDQTLKILFLRSIR
ncbi:MAG: hypothetical protein RLZZ204_1339, partial [Bacteroidota bacterium]